VRGTAGNPMSGSEVEQKCLALLMPSLETRRAKRLCDSVWDIEAIDDIRTLTPLLRR